MWDARGLPYEAFAIKFAYGIVHAKPDQIYHDLEVDFYVCFLLILRVTGAPCWFLIFAPRHQDEFPFAFSIPIFLDLAIEPKLSVLISLIF